VGLKKPNDLGLFDVQGNCFTWCSDLFDNYPAQENGTASGDKEGKLEVEASKSRVLRGGSFNFQASLVRSAYRSYYFPRSIS
jgi:formylglycine-generating enzyme required for sulfatase activity